MSYESLEQTVLQDPAAYQLVRFLPSLSKNMLFAPSTDKFCTNPEGWGPFSEERYDFTPCFMDAWLAVVSLFGILGGLAAVWYLRRNKRWTSIPKNWHFHTKLALLGTVIVSVALQASLQIEMFGGEWYKDFRFWVSVSSALSLIVIFAVQWLEHNRSSHPNGVVLFFWVFFILAYGVKLHSLVVRELYQTELPYFVSFVVSFGLGVAEFILEWLVPKKQSIYHDLEKTDQSPVEDATVFSRMTFGWMTPMMRYGYKHFLTQEDLPALRKGDSSEETGPALQKNWDHEYEKMMVARADDEKRGKVKERSPSIWLALLWSFGGPYALAGLFKGLSDVSQFIQPQLLRLLIAWVDSQRRPNAQPVTRGIAIALSMFAVSVMQTVSLNQYHQITMETGMRVRSSLIVMVYNKSLKLSNEGRASKSTGDIVNHMSVDTQRLADLSQFFQLLWSSAFQIILCMASMYQLLGLSFLAGVGVMILTIPLNAFIARYAKKLQKQQMKNKDARTRLMTEILNNMKSIKLYAWGQAFMKKLAHVRNDLELHNLRKIGATSALQMFTWNVAPIAVSTSTFAVFVLTNDTPLTTEIVFPALTLFNLLSFPLMALPMVISALVEATVAVKRLTDFFLADELQSDAIEMKEPAQKQGDTAVRIRDASFTWDRASSKTCLSRVNFEARKGELSCIVGRVGSGKSSLLQAMLGDVFKTEGHVTVHGRIAYVAQQPWVMNASVRDNILFNHRWDPEFYEATITACALTDDFKIMPDGDQTQVGERGISLSGGQKARLTLARALYARADIYVLDDVLSAVDQHVGRHLIDNVLGPNGLLASKTRILATNAITVLKEANFITLLRDGAVVETGTYTQLMAMRGDVAKLVKSSQNESRSSTPEEDRTPQESPNAGSDEAKTVTEDASDFDLDEEAMNDVPALDLVRPTAHSNALSKRRMSGATLRRASTASLKRPQGKDLIDDETAEARKKQNIEHSEQGKVKWSVYLEYAKANNSIAVSIYLLALIAAQTAVVGGSLWLKHWAEINQEYGQNPSVGKYIGIYLGIGVGGAFLMMTQSVLLNIFCSIEASRKIHERMAYAVFRSPMVFFETNPLGRILNRFSSDIYKIDEVLARTFNMLFVNTARAIWTLGLVVASTPVFGAVILPIGAIYVFIQGYYLRTSRELKRLDSVSKSPIFAHFQESLGGLTTIRAYRQQNRFTQENAWRTDANLRTYFPSVSANRWLAVRLEFIGSLVILCSALFAVVAITIGGGPSAGMLGLAMSYALQITGSLNWIVRQTVEVETNIVSVERCIEYSELKSEAPEILSKNRPNASWPSQGAVVFKNYSTRYREGLDLVLKDVNLSIKSHEKVGVVGRTGAGKSSLTLSLFRIIEAAAGKISIDNVDTSSIGLLDLRQRLAIIPQDAALFEGTVRDNLDPGHVHDDTDLWSALGHARLRDYVSSLDGQLEARIQEGGSNLSQGQRQLISLARALLTPTNILVLDEATAAIDIETDALLQSTLRSSAFSNRTIITIAHRINTILDSDRIVVLDKGKVVEFDTPAKLVSKRGLFYELVREAGLLSSFDGAGNA